MANTVGKSEKREQDKKNRERAVKGKGGAERKKTRKSLHGKRCQETNEQRDTERNAYLYSMYIFLCICIYIYN